MDPENKGMGWKFRALFLLFVAGGVWLMHLHISGSRSARRLPAGDGHAAGGAGEGLSARMDREIAEKVLKRKAAARRAAETGRPAESAGASGPSAPVPGRGTFGGGGFSYASFADEMRRVSSDPDAVRALLNDEATVRNYMSLPKVKAALSSKASLAEYLKDPENVSAWIADRNVNAAYGDDRVFEAVASSRLASEMLGHPSAIALMKDRSATADVMASNPPLASFFSDPRVVSVLMRDPNTAAALSR